MRLKRSLNEDTVKQNNVWKIIDKNGTLYGKLIKLTSVDVEPLLEIGSEIPLKYLIYDALPKDAKKDSLIRNRLIKKFLERRHLNVGDYFTLPQISPSYHGAGVDFGTSIRKVNRLTEDTIKQNGKWVNKGDTGKTHGKFKTKKEASYGGAFDIEDDMFFTKDDLMEFAYELEDKFREWSKDPNAEISDVYMTTPTHLVMEIMSDGAGHEAQVDIDMRRIRSPRNIDKYGDQILAQWKDSFIQYNGDPNEVLDESYDESTIEDYFNEAWNKYSELRDALYAFENAVQGNKDLEIAANSFITNIEEAAGDFWSDYDYYLNSEDEIEEEE